MKFIFLLIMAFCSSSIALVDMKNAHFSEQWVDIIVKGKKIDLVIDRDYSSRSLFSGIFGFGWCSNIETSLSITLEGNLILNECGGLAINYYPANYNTKLINTSVAKILALYKKKYPNKGPQYFSNLKRKMLTDHKVRSQLAGEMGFKIPTTRNTVFLANGKEVDRISFDGKYYVRTLPNLNVQKFDGSGRLVFLIDRKKNFRKISYKGNLISHIATNEGQKVTFVYNQAKKIKTILGPKNIRANYSFQRENLVKVKNGWSNSYNYKYDNNHNLIRINFPDSTYKVITYNQKKDWVKKFVDRDGCAENFIFTLSKESPKNHYWSTAIKTCQKKIVSKSRYEFWYSTRRDKEKYLSRVLSERNNNTLDIAYHQDFGKPVSIRKNADLTTLDYFPNGLVKRKSVSTLIVKSNQNLKYALSYKYDKLNRVKESFAEYYSKKGTPPKSIKTSYKYDKISRLASAKNSIGQFVTLKYNMLGLISNISDQAKKQIIIQYNKQVRKPSSIIRPKVGSIEVSYHQNGKIKSVKNKGGSSVTTQVVSTFNNFIEVIGPATTELSFNL